MAFLFRPTIVVEVTIIKLVLGHFVVVLVDGAVVTAPPTTKIPIFTIHGAVQTMRSRHQMGCMMVLNLLRLVKFSFQQMAVADPVLGQMAPQLNVQMGAGAAVITTTVVVVSERRVHGVQLMDMV